MKLIGKHLLHNPLKNNYLHFLIQTLDERVHFSATNMSKGVNAVSKTI